VTTECYSLLFTGFSQVIFDGPKVADYRTNNQGVVAHRERAAGYHPANAGSTPAAKPHSAAPLAHPTLPKAGALSPSAPNRVRKQVPEFLFADHPVVQLRQNARSHPGGVGSIPIGCVFSTGR
jgi:hypothetical protein